jgi:hypothetical protein
MQNDLMFERVWGIVLAWYSLFRDGLAAPCTQICGEVRETNFGRDAVAGKNDRDEKTLKEKEKISKRPQTKQDW